MQHFAATPRPFLPLATVTTSAVVGIVATLADWLVLVAVVAIGMPQRWAIVPAFLAGVILQFFGNQRLTFRAHPRGGNAATVLWRQARRFAAVEVGTLLLTAVVYNLAREAAGIDYRIARVITGLVIYFGFSLPLWHWVFAKPANGATAARQGELVSDQ